jgi:hypothetical protein
MVYSMAMAKSREFMDALSSLSEKEFSAYTVLLSKSPLTASEVGLYLGQTLESAKESLDELQKKGFAVVSPETVRTYSVKPLFHSLADQLTATDKMLTRVETSIGTSLEKSLNTVSSGVKNLTDAILYQNTDLNEILEGKFSDDEKAVKRILIENKKNLHARTTTLKTDLDSAVETAKAMLGADLDKIKGIVSDELAKLEKNLLDSTSEDHLNKDIDQLSSCMEAFKALQVGLTATIEQYDSELSDYITGFKSATSQTLSELGKSAKTIQTIQKTADASLASVAKELNWALSNAEEAFIEAIGPAGASGEKLSLQSAFTDMHVNVIKGAAKALHDISHAHTDLIKKLGSWLDKLSSGVKRDVRELSETIFGFTGPDSFAEKLLDSEARSLESESKKVEKEVSQWTDLVLAKTDELLGRIITDAITSLQSLEGSIGSLAEELLQQFSQSEPLTGIQAYSSRLGEYSEHISEAYGSLQTNLDKFRSEILEQLQGVVERDSSSISQAANTLERVINRPSGKKEEITTLSSDLEVLRGASIELGQLKDQANAKMIRVGDEILNSVRRLFVEPSKTILSTSIQLKEELRRPRDEVSNLVKNVTNEIRNILAKTRNELEKEKEKRGELEATLQEINAGASEVIERQIGIIGESVKKFKEKASRTLDTQLQRLEKGIDDEFAAFKEHSAEIGTAASGVIESQKVAISDLQEKMNENVLEPLRRISEDLSASLIKARELADKDLNEVEKGFSEAVLTVLGEVDRVVDSVGEKVTELADKNAKFIEAHSKQATRDINKLCTKETEKIALKTSSSINSLREKLNELRASFEEQTTKMTDGMEEEAANTVNSAGRQLSSLNEKLEAGLSELTQGVAEDLSNSVTSLISQRNATIKESISESTKNRDNRLSEIVKEIKESLKEQTSLIGSEVNPVIDEIKTGAKRNARVLHRLEESFGVPASTTTSGRTWSLFSKRAIKEHITGMVSRAKSTVFVGAPEPSYLPPAKELGKRKEVFFHIQLGEETEKNIETDGVKTRTTAENDLEAIRTLANVRLTTVHGVPYVVVNRDNEEVLIGMEGGEGKIDATATVSEEKGYISLVREVIAPSLLLDTEKQET